MRSARPSQAAGTVADIDAARAADTHPATMPMQHVQTADSVTVRSIADAQNAVSDASSSAQPADSVVSSPTPRTIDAATRGGSGSSDMLSIVDAADGSEGELHPERLPFEAASSPASIPTTAGRASGLIDRAAISCACEDREPAIAGNAGTIGACGSRAFPGSSASTSRRVACTPDDDIAGAFVSTSQGPAKRGSVSPAIVDARVCVWCVPAQAARVRCVCGRAQRDRIPPVGLRGNSFDHFPPTHPPEKFQAWEWPLPSQPSDEKALKKCGVAVVRSLPSEGISGIVLGPMEFWESVPEKPGWENFSGGIETGLTVVSVPCGSLLLS